MIVVDASALLELLFRRPSAGTIETYLSRPGQSLHAPHLVDVEVAHVVRRLVMRREIEAGRGREVLTDLADLPINRYAHSFLLSSAWDWRENVTAYDGVYVALAHVLDAPLFTCDRRLAKAVGQLVQVELL